MTEITILRFLLLGFSTFVYLLIYYHLIMLICSCILILVRKIELPLSACCPVWFMRAILLFFNSHKFLVNLINDWAVHLRTDPWKKSYQKHIHLYNNSWNNSRNSINMLKKADIGTIIRTGRSLISLIDFK